MYDSRMLQDLFSFNVAPLDLIVRAVVVYLAILLLLRISGKREMGQLSPTDFVAILLISNAVQNSMNGGDNSLIGGLLLASVLIALSFLISYLTYKNRIFRTIFEGTPTLLIHKGKLLEKNLAKEHMNESELRILLRKQGLHKLDEIETAILESDGSLSVTKKSSNSL